MWTREALVRVASRRSVIAGVASALSLTVGAGSGYIFAKKRLEQQYAELASQEIQEAKVFYKTLNKREEFETPESALEARVRETAAEALATYRGEVPLERPAEPEIEAAIVEVNVFDNATSFNLEEEIKTRSEFAPYVITHEEFLQAEPGYEQVVLTYYEADDVLADSRDEPVSDSDMTAGDNNLTRFGEGSGDPNVVYVRNDAIELDFEIVKSTGKYTEEVLGFTPEDRHPRASRSRGDDG